MGSTISKSMKEAQTEMMAKQIQNQKKMQMQIRQVQMAAQFAVGKERFHWYSAFYFLGLVTLPIAAIKSKNPGPIIPLVIITFVWAYQFDMFYGNKQFRVQKEAARLLREEPQRFYLPEGNNVYPRDQYKQDVNLNSCNNDNKVRKPMSEFLSAVTGSGSHGKS